MKPIVSYAYFRSETSQYEKEKGDAALQFEQFLPLIVRGHYCVWRGYDLHIFHDDHVMKLPYWKAMEEMQSKGLVLLHRMGLADALCRSMLWRMLPVFWPTDLTVVCRDIDSVPMPRDRACVEEWLSTKKTVHCIHDNSAHSGVMGGTTSVRSQRFRELISCESWTQFVTKGSGLDWTKQGADQHLLNRLLSLYAQETLVHELHHRVNDMGPVEIREICPPHTPGQPFTMDFLEIERANKLCPTIGGCWEPKEALAFYDSINFPERDLIRKCEGK